VTVADARRAYDVHAWQRTFDAYAGETGLQALDLDYYAAAAMLLGRMDDYLAIRERAYREQLDAGQLECAAQAAVWIAMQHMVQGEVGPGTAWLARADRLCAELGDDSVAAGYLVLSASFEAEEAGDFERAAELCGEAAAVGTRLGCADLAAIGMYQQGLLLLTIGRPEEGLARLDEAMLLLTEGELSPMVTGVVSCGVISGCWSAYELRRAQQWTAAMTAWCDDQADLGSFTGECKVRRAELKQLHGAWTEALAELAGVGLEDVDLWAAGYAAYVRGNLERLQGRVDSAEEHFTDAARLGCDPQPGLALLRLAQGKSQAARAMVRRGLAETQEPGRRVELLVALVEIALALGELPEADAAARELADLATGRVSPIVGGMRDQADGAVRLAEQRPEAALPSLRRALEVWVRERTPYQEAVTRLLLADACRALGDYESAARDTAIAFDLFTELGATPDLRRRVGGSDPLTARELEVLKLVATGATNKAIATTLVLSERTVDRHVSNILTKLEVPSRAAATAYAVARQLL
jgi:DNA-binding CsgD family transcriptional regulator